MRAWLRRIWGLPAVRAGVCLVALPLLAAAFWAILQANTITGGRFELAALEIVVLVLLVNAGALALLGLIFLALERWERRPRRWRRWLPRRRRRRPARSPPS